MANNLLKMKIKKYIPQRQYGFLSSDGDEIEIFFHLFSFKGMVDTDSTPPIAGECVEVELMENEFGELTSKALTVYRTSAPFALSGTVTRFNEHKGYGFVETNQKEIFYLHRSEIKTNEVPKIGDSVSFFCSSLEQGARACAVKIKS